MAATINMAASMLQVTSLSSLQTTPFPSLLEAVECIETIHQSGGPEILPSILKRTFNYIDGIQEPITRLTGLATGVGSTTAQSPLELAKEKKLGDLALAEYDLESLKDQRQQLSERLERLVSERASITQEIAQISGSPSVVGPSPGDGTPAQRQAQLQHDLVNAGIPSRRETNAKLISDSESLLAQTNAYIIQHASNVRNLKRAVADQTFSDAEIQAATAARQRMLSLTIGSSSALNAVLNEVITAIVKHYLVVQVTGLDIISQGLSQLEVLAGDSPPNANFISVILRRQKAVKALRFLSGCFGGSVAADADNAVRRIRDGSPAVFLQRISPSAYSVIQGVSATPTDTYLDRMLTAARSYEKVCLGAVSPPGQSAQNLQGGSPSPPKQQENFLPGIMQAVSGSGGSPGALRPSNRGFINTRPPSPVAFHIRDNESPSELTSPFDVFTGGMELAMPLRQRKNLSGNSTPSRELITESNTKEHTREWLREDSDREDDQEEQEEDAPAEVIDPPASKKTKLNEAKKPRKSKGTATPKGKPADSPSVLFSSEGDAFNSAAASFLSQLASKLAESPVSSPAVSPQQAAPVSQVVPQQQVVQAQGLPFPPGFMIPPFGFGAPAFFSAGAPNVFGSALPGPPPGAPPATAIQPQQSRPQSQKPYVKRHSLTEGAYNQLKSLQSVCITSYQLASPCGAAGCTRTHSVSSSNPTAQRCAAFDDLNSICRTCFQPGGCPFRHMPMTWRDRGMEPPKRHFQRV
jgi:hypothetical protein